jgi:hypothetical protein
MGRVRLTTTVRVWCALSAMGTLAPFGISQAQPRANVTRQEQSDVESSEAKRPIVRARRAPEIFYCDTPEAACRTSRDVFDISELRDLYVFVVWPGISGQHVQTVQFLLPDGNVYVSQKTQFSLGGRNLDAQPAVNARREVSGSAPAPHLMADGNKVHREGIPSLLTGSRGDSAVLTVLPVGGTYITQRNLSGAWQVRVLLDDRLALESKFTLKQREASAGAAEEERQ